MSKKMSFADLDNKMSKISPKGSMLSKNAFSRVDEWINTGNYMFNAQLSGSIFGGFPNSRSVMLSGDPGTGKTFLALNACREAQKLGYEIIYCDTEAAVDETVMVKFGIDPDRVRYQPIATVSEMRNFSANLIVTIKEAIDKGLEVPKIMMVLDSLGNMATTKEKIDAASGHMAKDMTKQGELRSMFRVLTTDLAEYKIPFIICNHTYQCALGETEVLMFDDSIKFLKDINIGDEVKTSIGNRKVTNTVEYEKTRVYNVELENGEIIICTNEHRFLVGDDPLNEDHWKSLIELEDGDEIIQF